MKKARSNEIMTGKELKFAASNNLQVWVKEEWDDGNAAWKCINKACHLEEGGEYEGTKFYYLGNGDIVPEDYEDNDLVQDKFNEGIVTLYKIKGVNYC